MKNRHAECLHWYLFVEKMKIGMLNVFSGIYLWRKRKLADAHIDCCVGGVSDAQTLQSTNQYRMPQSSWEHCCGNLDENIALGVCTCQWS